MAVRRARVADTSDETSDRETSPSTSDRRQSYAGGGGWGAPQPPRRDVVKAPYLDLSSGSKIVKLLSSEPDLWYLQHFLGPGKAPVMCYRSGSANPDLTIAQERMAESEAAGLGECPICTANNFEATYGYMINVIDMTEDGDTVRKWTFGNQFKNILMAQSQDPTTSPLNRETVTINGVEKYRPLYWKIGQSKVSGAWIYSARDLSVTDLRDNYDIEPLNEDEVKEFQKKKYGEEVMFYWPLNKMREFAEIARRIKQEKDAKNK